MDRFMVKSEPPSDTSRVKVERKSEPPDVTNLLDLINKRFQEVCETEGHVETYLMKTWGDKLDEFAMVPRCNVSACFVRRARVVPCVLCFHMSRIT